MIRTMILIAVLCFGCTPVAAQPEEKQRSLDAALGFLREHKAGGADLQTKKEPPLGAVFENHGFVVARFRQFPVAQVTPPGFKASNVLAVSKDAKVTHIKSVNELERFFRDHAPPSPKAGETTEILKAWLLLAQEQHQDGFYKFEILEKDFVVSKDRREIRGRAVVMQGGNGELAATMTFTEEGKVHKVMPAAAIRPGPRPICQATKLLDADPIVRKMAEQDLLIMGVAARVHLRKQRDAATPELRGAIDTLWQRIEKNGW